MERKRRTEILIRGNREISKKLVEEIKEKYDIKNFQEPNHGLVMIKMRETSMKQLFYLGEVLVSEAKVYVNGELGLGIVAGDNLELANDLAIIDGAYKGELKETKGWEDILLNEEFEINRREKEKEAKILETKVDFSTMDI